MRVFCWMACNNARIKEVSAFVLMQRLHPPTLFLPDFSSAFGAAGFRFDNLQCIMLSKRIEEKRNEQINRISVA